MSISTAVYIKMYSHLSGEGDNPLIDLCALLSEPHP